LPDEEPFHHIAPKAMFEGTSHDRQKCVCSRGVHRGSRMGFAFTLRGELADTERYVSDGVLDGLRLIEFGT